MFANIPKREGKNENYSQFTTHIPRIPSDWQRRRSSPDLHGQERDALTTSNIFFLSFGEVIKHEFQENKLFKNTLTIWCLKIIALIDTDFFLESNRKFNSLLLLYTVCGCYL